MKINWGFFHCILIIWKFSLREQKKGDLGARKILKEEASVTKEVKRALKEEAETPEKEALDNLRAEEGKQKQAKEEAEKKQKEEKAYAFFEKLDSDKVISKFFNSF